MNPMATTGNHNLLWSRNPVRFIARACGLFLYRLRAIRSGATSEGRMFVPRPRFNSYRLFILIKAYAAIANRSHNTLNLHQFTIWSGSTGSYLY